MITITDLQELEERVRGTLEENDLDELSALLADQHPADVADVIDRLDDEDQLRVFQLLSPVQAAEVLDETSAEATRELLERLPALFPFGSAEADQFDD
jgi:magnesium transporter